ncbi:MAG: Flp pilus assembly protein CpaB [Endomicrobiales bacterium]|nr:Flp pilus assembly protein CpaB [Endomicrobiales bacterium]
MKKPLLIALLCGFLAALFAGMYFVGIEKKYSTSAQKVSVLCANKYIDQDVILDGSMFEEALVPKDYIQPRALGSVKELYSSDGRKLFMSVVPIEKGEQLILTKLYTVGLETGLSSIIPTGKRAVTLYPNEEGLADRIKPGNRIDIIAVFDFEDKAGKLQQAAATVLQNILVLSVDKAYLGGAQKNQSEQGVISQENSPVRSAVCVSVLPQEAELLALCCEKSIVRFSLRPVCEETLVQTCGAKVQDIIEGVSAAVQKTQGDKTQQPAGVAMEQMQKKQRETLELLKKYQKSN